MSRKLLIIAITLTACNPTIDNNISDDARIDSLQNVIDSLEFQKHVVRKPVVMIPALPIHLGDTVPVEIYVASVNQLEPMTLYLDGDSSEVESFGGGLTPLVQIVASDTGMNRHSGEIIVPLYGNEIPLSFEFEFYVQPR